MERAEYAATGCGGVAEDSIVRARCGCDRSDCEVLSEAVLTGGIVFVAPSHLAHAPLTKRALQAGHQANRSMLASWVVESCLVLCLGCSSPRNGFAIEAQGIEYRHQALSQPRTNQVHILRLELGAVQPRVVMAPDPDGEGPAEAALTDPRTLARDATILAFINANPWDSFPDKDGKRNQDWFEGQPVDIHGLAVADGQMRSPVQPKNTSVWFDQRGRIHIGDVPAGEVVEEGMAGFEQILKDGAVVARASDKPNPRTSIGVDKDGQVMWLVVVDGRQPGFSEGLTYRELGRLMREFGCWNAVNMDGGGSSIMGVAKDGGGLQIINSPSDRVLGPVPKIRPLPMILTIQKKTRGSERQDGTN